MRDGLLFNKEALYEHAFIHAPIGKALLTLEGEILEVNAAYCRTVGYSKNELLRQNFRSFTHADDIEESDECVRRLIDGEIDSFCTIKRYVHKQRFLIWAQVDVTLIRNELGAPLFLVAQNQDIADRKRAEDLLKENEQKHHSLFENHPDLVFMASLTGELLSVNASGEAVTGYSNEELGRVLLEESYPSLFHENHSKYLHHFMLASRGSCEDFEIIAWTKQGQPIILRMALIPMMINNDIVGVYGIGKDITEFKRNSENLRKTQELYQLISENVQDLITYLTPDGITHYVSPNVKRILGYSAEEVLNKHTWLYWHPDDFAAFTQSNQLQNSDSDTFLCRVRHKDGHYIWFETLATVIRNEAGNIDKVIGVGRDITERNQAEEVILQREAVYRRLVEESPDAIVISTDREWRYVNKTLVQLFGGSSKEELIGTPSHHFVHPDSERMYQQQVSRAEQGQTAQLTEQRLLRKNGEPFFAETISIPTIYQGEHAVHTIIRDISRKKKEQELVIHSEKLHVAGQLAAGIAHEIRNPLTAIKGFIKLMNTGMKQDYLKIVSTEVERIETIVTELLLLAKPKEEKFEHTDLVNTVKHVVTLLESQANMSNIEIVAEYEADSLSAYCDENQLKQAFINFLKNAIEAMPDGGTIRIRTALIDDHIMISFSDQGSGIPDDILLKLGEPFFTTKQSGTGLGFMVSKRIIESHRGKLCIVSRVGEGTCIGIRIPCQ